MMQSKIVYGTKNGNFNGEFVEVFYTEEDRHLGINWTHDTTATVYHFIIKGNYTFDNISSIIEDELSICININDAHNMLEIFFDNAGLKYLDDYLEYEPEMRTENEIQEYLDEAFDKVWLMRTHPVEHLPEIEKRRLEAIERILNTYDDIPEEGFTDWECGYWNGILGALRWVLGDEKDFLDT